MSLKSCTLATESKITMEISNWKNSSVQKVVLKKFLPLIKLIFMTFPSDFWELIFYWKIPTSQSLSTCTSFNEKIRLIAPRCTAVCVTGVLPAGRSTAVPRQAWRCLGCVQFRPGPGAQVHPAPGRPRGGLHEVSSSRYTYAYAYDTVKLFYFSDMFSFIVVLDHTF